MFVFSIHKDPDCNTLPNVKSKSIAYNGSKRIKLSHETTYLINANVHLLFKHPGTYQNIHGVSLRLLPSK